MGGRAIKCWRDGELLSVYRLNQNGWKIIYEVDGIGAFITESYFYKT